MATEGGGSVLLEQLKQILSSDQLIDEIGYVHPSQLASLHEGGPDGNDAVAEPSVFWCAHHKLAISTEAFTPLYKAAKSAFITTRKAYQTFLLIRDKLASDAGNTEAFDYLTKELLSHSRAVVLLNPGYKTAWDVRKKVLVDSSSVGSLEELRLSSLALSFNPKSEEAWAHRRWAICSRMELLSLCEIPDELLQVEFELVKSTADRSRMNYRAWRHCYWFVQWMSPSQMLHELKRWQKWAALHVAESSCFHFRRGLFQKLLIDENCLVKVKAAWLEETDWNKDLIKLYLGREALWLHQRFLFYLWVHYFRQTDDHKDGAISLEIAECLFPEAEMAFANSCILSCLGDETEDSRKQIVHACTFKLWVLWKCKENLLPLSTLHVQSEELNAIEQLLGSKAAHQKALWEGLLLSCRAVHC